MHKKVSIKMSRKKGHKMKTKIISIFMICLCAAPLFAAKAKKEGKIRKIKPEKTLTLKVKIPSSLKNDYNQALSLHADELLQNLNVTLELVSDKEKNPAACDMFICDISLPEYADECVGGTFLDLEQNDLISKWGQNLLAQKKAGLQKNKFFDSPDRCLHGYGLNLVEQKTAPYEYKNILQLCNAIIESHFGYVEFGAGYYNPEDGSFYEKLADDGPYFYTLKVLNALNQNQYKFKDANPGNFESLIKHYEENIDFNEVDKTDGAEVSDASEETLKPEKSEEKKYPNPYGSNFVWTISSASAYPELCLTVINQLSQNELETFSKYPVSLYKIPAYPEDVEKVAGKIEKLFEEKTIAAVQAADNEAYEAAILDLKTTITDADYSVYKDFYAKQAQNRFFAEKVSKRTKK